MTVDTKKLKSFGSRFAFEFFLETMHKPLIQGLKNYLKDIAVSDIPGMVKRMKFPNADHLDFSAVGDNIEHIEKIDVVRLMEFIAEARPELAEAIQGMGNAGADYMAALRAHLLDNLRQPAGDQEFQAENDTTMLHCDNCDKKWPVKKGEAAVVTKCPFCDHGAKEKKTEGVEEDEEDE